MCNILKSYSISDSPTDHATAMRLLMPSTPLANPMDAVTASLAAQKIAAEPKIP